jgi:hypothetical protein
MKDLTRVLLAEAAEDLNEVLKLKPEIVTEFSSSLKGDALKAAEKKFEEQLGKDLIESAQLIAEVDVLKQSTADVLKALGVSEIKAQVASAGKTTSVEKGTERKKGGRKESPRKERVKMPSKKPKALPKKGKVRKEVKADLDERGFPKGSKRSEAVKLMMTGKYSMADLKKKFGATFYGPLKKLLDDGYVVKKSDKGHIIIASPKRK